MPRHASPLPVDDTPSTVGAVDIERHEPPLVSLHGKGCDSGSYERSELSWGGRMTAARRQNAMIVLVLVLILAGVGYALRVQTRSDQVGASSTTAAPSPSTTSSPTPSASSSASPSVSPSPSPSPTAPKTFSKVAFLGDSYAAGTGASSPDKRWTTILSQANHWTETNLAHPQTGYARAGSHDPCTSKTCPAYVDVVPAAIASGADLVIITGGANDLGIDAPTANAAVAKTLADLHAGLPHATIIVVNPWWDMRPANPALATYTSAIKEVSANAGVTFADTGQPLAGQLPRVTEDGIDANDTGQAALAEVVRAALKTAGFKVS